ncbi:hypothetical protein V6N12_047333 [Hibiscus sabdariffa]|uniref:Retrotransposon gag domain-containing protein n=1 Tax=Hibiscus sabdariffa TaxID=183260 RepID=A0ABR2DAY3_9ROSI
MTRANPRGLIYELDPEIKRTRRELRNPPAQAGRAIVPPDNRQQPVKTVRDYLAEDLEGLNPAVTIPEFEAEHFKLKPLMINMLNTLGQFGGSPAENARQHLKSFLEICNSFKIHGVSNDVLKLKLFPYSLTDKTKAWLNNLPPGSLRSWTDLCRSFLGKFSYSNMTDHLRNQITSFRQEDDEAMHEAWERYRDLFRRCPMHGLPEWTQVSIFYNSVNTPTRMMLDASANGTLLDKPPRESLEILDKLAQNDYQHPTSRRGTTRRGTIQLDSSDTILAQISTLTNMVKNMQRQTNTQEVKALDAFCELCGNNHDTSECGQAVDSSCYVGNYNKNTYNPAWRNHPNFSWKNQNNTLNSQQPSQTGYQNQPRQNPPNLPRQDYQQPSEYKTMENTLTQPLGGFPSDTEVAKGATHEQCNAITTRSGRILEPTNNQRGKAANPSAATDIPAETNKLAEIEKDHQHPPTTHTREPSTEPSHTNEEKLERTRPPPPFPQRLKKQQQDYQFKKFFDILKQVHINLPLVEALQQMPNYAKFLKDMVSRKKRIEEFETAAAIETCLALMHNKVPAKKSDPGSFTIECFIGHNYPTKALCDLGASINLMPTSVFQKLGIGEAKPTTVMLQLADHSFVQPEGKIKDILVKVDKFIFPADFLILDCEADENAPIILGRPFLSTSRAMIDFDKDEIVFKVDDDQVKMKALTKQLEQKNKGKGIDTKPTQGTQRPKLYLGAHVERDKAVMSLRDA